MILDKVYIALYLDIEWKKRICGMFTFVSYSPHMYLGTSCNIKVFEMKVLQVKRWQLALKVATNTNELFDTENFVSKHFNCSVILKY